MSARSFVVLIAAFFLFQVSRAQTGEKWTLEKCINYAYENNLQVRESAITAKISGTDHLQSKLNLLPTIDVNGNFSNDFGNGVNLQTFTFVQGTSQSLQLQLNGNMPIFTGLQQIYNIEKARFDFLAAKFDNENAKNTIALNVASAYLQVLLNKEIERVAEKQKTLSEDQKTVVLNRIKSGALSETAIYDIDAQLGRDEVNIVSANNAIDLSILALEQLLQLKYDRNFDIDVPEIKTSNLVDISTLSPQGIYEYALMNQPSVRGADARVMSANSTRKISYGGFSPTLTAFGGLSTGWLSLDRKTTYSNGLQGNIVPSPGDTLPFTIDPKQQFPSGSSPVTLGQDLRTNFRQAVGLTLDVPLFSKGQKVLNMQKARLQVQLRQMQLEGTKNQLQQDIEQAYANARAAEESYLANNKSLASSQKAYEATSVRYKAGIASNFDIEQAKQNLIAAESELLKAKYTYVFRMKILDFYQGKAITLN